MIIQPLLLVLAKLESLIDILRELLDFILQQVIPALLDLLQLSRDELSVLLRSSPELLELLAPIQRCRQLLDASIAVFQDEHVVGS